MRFRYAGLAPDHEMLAVIEDQIVIIFAKAAFGAPKNKNEKSEVFIKTIIFIL
jgi:hypothetical protein